MHLLREPSNGSINSRLTPCRESYGFISFLVYFQEKSSLEKWIFFLRQLPYWKQNPALVCFWVFAPPTQGHYDDFCKASLLKFQSRSSKLPGPKPQVGFSPVDSLTSCCMESFMIIFRNVTAALCPSTSLFPLEQSFLPPSFSGDH